MTYFQAFCEIVNFLETATLPLDYFGVLIKLVSRSKQHFGFTSMVFRVFMCLNICRM